MGGATAGCEGDNVPALLRPRGTGGTIKIMYSSQFTLYTGVRQGCILFHLLFNIYINELIYALHESG